MGICFCEPLPYYKVNHSTIRMTQRIANMESGDFLVCYWLSHWNYIIETEMWMVRFHVGYYCIWLVGCLYSVELTFGREVLDKNQTWCQHYETGIPNLTWTSGFGKARSSLMLPKQAELLIAFKFVVQITGSVNWI